MRTTAWLTAAVLVVACKGNGNNNEGGAEDESGTAEGTSGVSQGPASDTTPSGTSTGQEDSGEAEEGGNPPIYDVGHIPDVPGFECDDVGKGGGGGGPMMTGSYIWIANSSQGTVSKIDTVSLEEVGRYDTHPGVGDPSRTSVNLNGDVAVANRNGGVVKFYANKQHCQDRNGNGSIETSDGPDDVLSWDDEECRAWFTEFGYASQRPVAWTAGDWNPGVCAYTDAKVWTSGTNGSSGVDVILIDGNNGDVEEIVEIPEVSPQFYGIYGGAVDAEGNFWGSQLSSGHVVNVDRQTMEYNLWTMGAQGYGMTVDENGRVWVCSYEVGRFDPETETWDTVAAQGGGGCMSDGEGTLWLAANPLVGVDIETLEIVATHPLPEYVHGVSIDFEGYVWGVSMNTSAYKIDRETGDYEAVSGLIGPYTYSDMTGFGLANAGGWVPTG
jgi:hypothetical protein